MDVSGIIRRVSARSAAVRAAALAVLPAAALAAAAAFSPAGVRIVRGERLRLKESDRIASTCALLRAFGCAAEETPDGIVVPPGPPPPAKGLAEADAAGDHRIAMTAAMLATVRPCLLRGADSVAKSWPSFFDDYRAAGGRAAEAT